MWSNSALPTILIIGRTAAIGDLKARVRRVISHRRLSVTKIWTTTEIGGTTPIMVTSGFPIASLRDGRPTMKATGPGFPHGVGRGSTMSLGATHHFTMAGG